MSATKDSRFDTTAWEGDDQAAASGSDAASTSASASGTDDDEHSLTGSEIDDDDDDDDRDEAPAKVVKPLTPEELASFQARERKKGIVYISHIPHGMTVAKVRHLLSGFGDVERIYLQDGRKGAPGKGKGKELSNRARKRSAHFTEGWVEYSSKKAAKAVAGLLNAQPIAAAMGGFGGGGGGGRKGANAKNARRWRDEVWTMKYLPGFKWTMLSEQLANERASHTSRLRAELSQSAFEQKDYLRKVERARVMREKEEKRKRRLEKEGVAPAVEEPASSSSLVRTYKQKEALYKDVRDQRADSGKRQREEQPRAEEKGTIKKRKGAAAGEGQKAPDGDRALQGVLGKIF